MEILTPIFFLILIYGSAQGLDTSEIKDDPLTNSTRIGKFFPLFTLVRFSNEACTTNNEENGVCYTRGQCSALGGIAAGTCARGLGVCCQFFSTCHSTINQNGTFFRNPDFPNKYNPMNSDVCQARIRRQVNTCQLRLNFIKFDLDGPSLPPPSSTPPNQGKGVETGVCMSDILTISAQASGVPTLCGNMEGQHLYLDFGSSDTINLNVLLSGNVQKEREWNIEILMIPCRSEARPPSGCLQYFEGVSGQVQSFNFLSSFHLANLAYTVCIRQEEGMRSIDWSACNSGDVKFTGPSPIPTPPQTGLAPDTCKDVKKDYFIIPNGVSYPLPMQAPNNGGNNNNGYEIGQSYTDRFCDPYFQGNGYYIRTSVKPFTLGVVSDGFELASGNNPPTNDASAGFCLKWQQSPT